MELERVRGERDNLKDAHSQAAGDLERQRREAGACRVLGGGQPSVLQLLLLLLLLLLPCRCACPSRMTIPISRR